MTAQEDEEIPTRITNIELSKIVREQNASNKALNKRLQELKKKLEDKEKEEAKKEEVKKRRMTLLKTSLQTRDLSQMP